MNGKPKRFATTKTSKSDTSANTSLYLFAAGITAGVIIGWLGSKYVDPDEQKSV